MCVLPTVWCDYCRYGTHTLVPPVGLQTKYSSRLRQLCFVCRPTGGTSVWVSYLHTSDVPVGQLWRRIWFIISVIDRGRNNFDRGRINFDCGQINFDRCQLILTAVKLIFTAVEIILTAVELILTAVELILTAVEIILTTVEFILTAVEFILNVIQQPIIRLLTKTLYIYVCKDIGLHVRVMGY